MMTLKVFMMQIADLTWEDNAVDDMKLVLPLSLAFLHLLPNLMNGHSFRISQSVFADFCMVHHMKHFGATLKFNWMCNRIYHQLTSCHMDYAYLVSVYSEQFIHYILLIWKNVWYLVVTCYDWIGLWWRIVVWIWIRCTSVEVLDDWVGWSDQPEKMAAVWTG